MPISTSSFEDGRDNRYEEYEDTTLYDTETLTFSGLSIEMAEALLKRLGGGVAEKLKIVEGIGWKATLAQDAGGTNVEFDAHEELLDDLIRRFEEMADKAV
ncbi:MAG: hypothetical protein AAF702_21770 [Chloroflexota bacterium]